MIDTFSRVQIFIAIFLLVILAAALLVFGRTSNASALTEPIQMRWLLPHGPKSAFDNATSTFNTILTKESGGDLQLKESLLISDVNIKANSHQFMKFVETEKTGMVSEYVGHLSYMHDPAFGVFDLPYLFKDYDSALAFLDGPKAQALLDTLSESSEYKFLAFSMSGGMRIFVSKGKKIMSVKDLQGMRMYSGFAGAEVVSKTLRAFGASPDFDSEVEFSPSKELLRNYDAVEVTYSRIQPLLDNDPEFVKYITETNHSLSLTVMLVSKEFYNSLSTKDRVALQKAAHEAAIVEKRDTIATETVTKQRLLDKGVTIVSLTPEQRAPFEEATAVVRQKFDPQFQDILSLIQK